jgi:hypothetical protein
MQLNSCIWTDAERAVHEGTCEAKLLASEEKKKSKAKLTTTTTTIRTVTENQLMDNSTDNSTRFLKSDSISIKTNIYSLFIISFIFLLL